MDRCRMLRLRHVPPRAQNAGQVVVPGDAHKSLEPVEPVNVLHESPPSQRGDEPRQDSHCPPSLSPLQACKPIRAAATTAARVAKRWFMFDSSDGASSRRPRDHGAAAGRAA
jgi:hypothetical protein